MSESATPQSLTWHQRIGLALLLPVVAVSIWTLAAPAAARGWIFLTMALYLLTVAYDWWTRTSLAHWRLWLVALTLAIAGLQGYVGVWLLTAVAY